MPVVSLLNLLFLPNFLNHQALTYRAGHHSTSDDSTMYRSADEIEHWRKNRDPVSRFRKWIGGKGWWNDAAESELRNEIRKKVKISVSAIVIIGYWSIFVLLTLAFVSLACDDSRRW